MATVTPITVVPHTRIDNDIILNMAEIGVYCYAVYSAIKMHRNQKTGKCIPSYSRLAHMTGIHRSTVIECVKKLRARNLVDRRWRFKEDGSHTSNQYNFAAAETSGSSQPQGTAIPVPSQQAATAGQPMQGSRPERPPLVAEDDHPGRPGRPEQVFSLNKEEERTSEPLASLPTEKQKACPHPPEEIACLSENIIICNHCFALLDEHPLLATITVPSSNKRASAECDPDVSGEPETKRPPVGKAPTKTAAETPRTMA